MPRGPRLLRATHRRLALVHDNAVLNNGEMNAERQPRKEISRWNSSAAALRHGGGGVDILLSPGGSSNAGLRRIFNAT